MVAYFRRTELLPGVLERSFSNCKGSLPIVKAESSRIVHKKVNEAVDDDITRVSGGVMNVTFHDDVFTSLNLSFTTWAASGEIREESLSIFSDGDISSSHVSEAST